MGFGHAVYRYSDPRNAVIKECALQVPNLIHIRQIQLFGQIRGLAGQELCVGQAQKLSLFGAQVKIQSRCSIGCR
jgi:citrate synthase